MGTFLGDDFGNLMESCVDGFLFNVVCDLMNVGSTVSTMWFVATAL